MTAPSVDIETSTRGPIRYRKAVLASVAQIVDGYTATDPAPEDIQLLKGHVGLEITPFGTGSDDGTFTMDVYLLKHIESQANAAGVVGAQGWIRRRLGTATCRMGTAVGAAGGAVVATERFCEAITAWTLTAFGTFLDAINPALVTVYNPGANLIALLRLPDLDNHYAFELTFNNFAAGTTAANALIESKT